MWFRKSWQIGLFLVVLLSCITGSVLAAGSRVTELPETFPTTDTTYYGRWIANPSTITFNLDGGSGATNLDGATGVDTGGGTMPVPTKTGFTFAGWYDNASFSGSAITVVPSVYPPGGVTYYAKWVAIPFDVLFETNGGSAVLLQTKSVSDNRLTMPASPERDGYTFVGWYKDESLTQPWNFASDTVSAETTLYASWRKGFPTSSDPIEYWSWDQIELVSQGGTAESYFAIGDTKQIVVGTEILTMQVYGFNHDLLPDGTTNKSNITFGTKDLMSVSYGLNGSAINAGGWSATEVRTWANNTLYDSLPGSIRDAIVPVSKSTSNGTALLATTDSVFLFSEMELRGANLNSLDGEGLRYPIFSIADSSRVKKLSNGAGAASNYWTRSASSSGATDFVKVGSDGTLGVAPANTSLGMAFGFAIGNAPTNTYAVTFESNGGTTVDTISSGYNDLLSVPTAPTKDGYGFDGWYKDGACLDDWNFAIDRVTENVTLYAKWRIDPYVVATNADFTWVPDISDGGYPAVGKTGNGYYKYTGTDDYVTIPNSINGTTLTSYYNMFNGVGASVKGVANQTDQVTSMLNMFYGSLVTTLDLSGLDTSNVTNMRGMFGNSATMPDLSNFDTSNVTNMKYMFYHSNATTLDLSNFDTSNVTDMSHMFSDSKATTLDLSSFNTSNVITMRNMFIGSNATMLDLSNFDTSNVTIMTCMFQDSKTTTFDLSNFDTANVTEMVQMFYNSKATTLDLSSFDTSSVTSMARMFNGSLATTGYARTTTDATKLNASSSKPAGLTFITKPAPLPAVPQTLPQATDPITYSWAEIKTISEAGLASSYMSIGQTKEVTLSTGEKLIMQIYGFNHDDRADGTGKAGITFGLKGLMVDNHFMNPSNINQYGWDGSDMRAYLNGVTTTNQNTSYATTSIYSKLPADLKAVITPVKKYTSGGYSDQALVTSTDNLFLFSEEEVGFTNPAYSTSGEGTQYPIFTDNTSRIKLYPNSNTGWWWLRSAYNINNYYFLGVGSGGILSNGNAINPGGVAFGFSI